MREGSCPIVGTSTNPPSRMGSRHSVNEYSGQAVEEVHRGCIDQLRVVKRRIDVLEAYVGSLLEDQHVRSGWSSYESEDNSDTTVGV